jgi:hypothetical protein
MTYENLKANIRIIREHGTPAGLATVLLAVHIAGGPDVSAEAFDTAKNAVEDNLRCIDTQYDKLINTYMDIIA